MNAVTVIERGPAVYRVSSAAAALGVSRRTIHRMIERGDMRSKLVGRCRFIPAEDINAIIAGATFEEKVDKFQDQVDRYISTSGAATASMERLLISILERLGIQPAQPINDAINMPWKMMEAMPDDRKDGREILLRRNGIPATIGRWFFGDWMADRWVNSGWVDASGRYISDVTHWTDVEGPMK